MYKIFHVSYIGINRDVPWTPIHVWSDQSLDMQVKCPRCHMEMVGDLCASFTYSYAFILHVYPSSLKPLGLYENHAINECLYACPNSHLGCQYLMSAAALNNHVSFVYLSCRSLISNLLRGLSWTHALDDSNRTSEWMRVSIYGVWFFPVRMHVEWFDRRPSATSEKLPSVFFVANH